MSPLGVVCHYVWHKVLAAGTAPSAIAHGARVARRAVGVGVRRVAKSGAKHGVAHKAAVLVPVLVCHTLPGDSFVDRGPLGSLGSPASIVPVGSGGGWSGDIFPVGDLPFAITTPGTLPLNGEVPFSPDVSVLPGPIDLGPTGGGGPSGGGGPEGGPSVPQQGPENVPEPPALWLFSGALALLGAIHGITSIRGRLRRSLG